MQEIGTEVWSGHLVSDGHNSALLDKMYLQLYVHCNYNIIPQEQQHSQPTRAVEEWMLVCQRNADLQLDINSQQEVDWTQGAGAYPNLEEMPTFISRH